MPLEISRGLSLSSQVTSYPDKKGGGATNLKTLTDHPIFATSPLSVSSSEARVSAVRVLESVTGRWRHRRALYWDHRTCKAEIVELFLIRCWTIGDAINQGTQHWTATGFVDAEDVWPRCCWGQRVIGVRGKERGCLVGYGWDIAGICNAILCEVVEGR